MAALERDQMAGLAQALRDGGIPVPVVSIGSTPSSMCGDGSGGITELHAGKYVFFDRQQVMSGSCSRGEIACYVLARVVSVSHERGEALIDAGATALHKDSAGLSSQGELLDAKHAGLVIRKMTQELGVVGRADGGALGSQLKLGDVVRVLPNHSCMTAASFPLFQVVRERDGGRREIIGAWVPARGW
jgi:D-serine deaminase-like pyridoxal phosphate-dependent protein